MTKRAMILKLNGGNLRSSDTNQENNNKRIANRDSDRNEMKAEFIEQEKITIPNLERDYENAKITF